MKSPRHHRHILSYKVICMKRTAKYSIYILPEYTRISKAHIIITTATQYSRVVTTYGIEATTQYGGI